MSVIKEFPQRANGFPVRQLTFKLIVFKLSHLRNYAIGVVEACTVSVK